MNSKVLVTIIIIVSATLGLYLGANQVTSKKENIKDTHSDGLYAPSGDVSNDNNIELSDYHNIVNLINHPENMPAKYKSLVANINESISKLISGEQKRKNKYFLKNGVLNGVLLDLDNNTIK